MTRPAGAPSPDRNGVLVLNAGSSSIKFALYALTAVAAEPAIAWRGQISGIGRDPVFRVQDADGTNVVDDKAVSAADHGPALAHLLAWIRKLPGAIQLLGVGHRVVHGGRSRREPVQVTPAILEELDALSPLAPHHQPHNLSAIRVLAESDPALPQVACFDTAFHAGQDDTNRRLPLPREYARRGLQRYGFHGLSYEYISRVIRGSNPGQAPSRVLIAHLGNGASLCAVHDGVSVATTMGFSTLDGLMMGTRCGTLDPGVLLHLMREDGLDEPALTDLLYNRCGLLGTSGISADMQQLLASENPHADEAIELYCHTLIKQIGGMVAALEGVDAIVFTGGIGEHAAPIRARLCERLAWLGVDFDTAANAAGHTTISTADSRVAVRVIPTDEERVIARHTVALLDPASA